MTPPSAPLSHPAWKIWSNPFFLRYCRSRLRPRGLGISILLTIIVAGFITALCHSVGFRNETNAADAARWATIPLLVLQGVILFVLGTAQVSGGITAERDEGVIDYQRLIPMSPLAKVLGYLFGLPIREYAMFLVTVPFTVWALWRGGVGWSVWMPLYAVVLSSTLLYHLTGLVTGTVVRNRRWAFLISIGLVFCLYTIVPQAAKAGLVFFKYLTINPVFEECLPRLLPASSGGVVSVLQHLAPSARFFGLNLPEAVFTIFSQGGLILTFLVMLGRKWRHAEAHLLGKLWTVGVFLWLQLLLLGNALPLIEPGQVFPSHNFANLVGNEAGNWGPLPTEAVSMAGLYGLVSLLILLIAVTIITPPPDEQLRGWRRTRKQGGQSLPLLGDASTSFWATGVMAIAGGAGWYLFTRALVESSWFPGHAAPPSLAAAFGAVMLATGIAFQSLLEARGSRPVVLAAILVGVLPVMIGTVLGTLGDRLIPLASWVTGISPAVLPFYATNSLLTLAELPPLAARAIPRAFAFWLLVDALVAIWLAWQLRAHRRETARRVFEMPPDHPAPPGP